MDHLSKKTAVVENGIAFTVTTLDFANHECIISKEALLSLSALRNGDFNPLEIFQANEAKICGVARRLIAARVKGSPLQIGPQSFH
jgi:hypothetical protein